MYKFDVVQSAEQKNIEEIKMRLVEGTRYLRIFANQALMPAPAINGNNDEIASVGMNDSQNAYVERMLSTNEAEFLILKEGELLSLKRERAEKSKYSFVAITGVSQPQVVQPPEAPSGVVKAK